MTLTRDRAVETQREHSVELYIPLSVVQSHTHSLQEHRHRQQIQSMRIRTSLSPAALSSNGESNTPQGI